MSPMRPTAKSLFVAASQWSNKCAVWTRPPTDTASQWLQFGLEHRTVVPENDGNKIVVKVLASSVNMSDVKLRAGLMPFVKPPIVTGRDFSGTVVAAPPSSSWQVGQDVYGTGGSLGFLRDGSHAQYLVLDGENAILCPKPSRLSHEQAGTLGVPYLTAYLSLVQHAKVQPDDVVVVQGANGMVGSAALQLAKAWTQNQATTIGLVRRPEIQSLGGADHVLQTTDYETAEALGNAIRECSQGTTKDFATVFVDTVGGDSTTLGLQLLGPGGRMVVMASPHPNDMARFNVFEFYRKQLQLFGVNTLCPDDVVAKALTDMTPLFESGQLAPLSISSQEYTLDNLPEAFDVVEKGIERARVLIRPS